jgi:DtxR family manganese transport transcriptional regulator
MAFSSREPASTSLENALLGEMRMTAEAKAPRSPPAGDLPTETTQASRFGKTRTAQSTALLEDYVELIADLLAVSGEARPTDVARRLGVSHATAIKTIARLKREGLATAKPYRGVFLTPQGHELADRVRARHRLVVEVLLALGVPREAAESDAEGIEHHVCEATLAAFSRFLRSGRES